MSDKAVELVVAGQSCRVVTTADEQELQALGKMVEEKLAGVLQPGRPVDTRAMLLAAVALANDVREQRQRADTIADKARSALRGLLTRVDKALEDSAAVVEKKPVRKRERKSRSTSGDNEEPS